MKCLTLQQPWASLLAVGEKHVETRHGTFGRVHLGELAIAASATFPGKNKRLCGTSPFREVLARHALAFVDSSGGGTDALPRGVILAVVDVVGYDRTDRVFRSDGSPVPGLPVPVGAHERAFGDYRPGRVAIFMRNVRRLAAPVPVERIERGVRVRQGGALGLYVLSPACAAAVRAQLGDPGEGARP